MACKITYRGRKYSEEYFDGLVERGEIPEFALMSKTNNTGVSSLLYKSPDVFYKEIPEGSYTFKELEKETLSEASQSLLRLMSNRIPDDIQINVQKNQKFYKNRKRILGEYNATQNIINIYSHEDYEGNMEQTLMHELFHASFDDYIGAYTNYLNGNEHNLTDDQISALNDFNNLFEYYHNNIPEDSTNFKNKYDNKNEQLKEFATEVFTNPSFLSTLSRIDLNKEENRPNLNKWIDKLIEVVLNLFGIKRGSLAGALMSNITFLMSTPRPYVYYNDAVQETSNKEVEDVSDIPDSKYAEQKKWVEIIDNHVKEYEGFDHFVDENGKEHSYYLWLDKKYNGVTSTIKTDFRGFEEEYDWIEKLAEREWDKAGHSPEKDLKIIGYNETLTKKEFIEEKRYEHEKNIARGKIIHYTFQKLIGSGNINNIQSKINKLKNEYDLKDENFDNWVSNIYKNYTAQMYFTNRTQNFSEVPMKSDELGIATLIDHLIIYGDGQIGINEWKSGKSFQNKFTDIMMKYGDVPGVDITNTNINAAKLQVMFSAVLTKMNFPEAIFKNLTVQWVNRTKDTKRYNDASKVNVSSYLKIIELWMKDNHPEVYEKYKNTNLFQVSDYVGYDNKYVTEMKRKGIEPTRYEQLLETEILRYVQEGGVSPRAIADQAGRKLISQREKLAEAARKILDFETTEELDKYADDVSVRDIHAFSRWVLSYEDIDNPYLNTFKKIYDKRIHQVRREVRRKKVKFETLLQPIFDKWKKDNGMEAIDKLGKGRLNYVEPWNTKGTGLFQFAWVSESNQGYTKDVLVHPKKHPEAWSKLTDNEKKLMEFFHETLHSYWDPKNPESVMGRVVTKDQHNNDVTNYDKVKQRFSGFTNKQWEYEEGMTPRFHMTLKEVFSRYKFSGKTLNFIYDKYLTWRLENSWDEWMNEDDIIPVKGVETDHNTQDDMYTRNVEVIFDRMVRNMEMKDKMDYVYAVGQGLRTYLTLKKDGQGAKLYKNTIAFLEDKLLMDILNQIKQQPFSSKMFRSPFKFERKTVGSDYEQKGINMKAISPTKILLSLKHLASASLMWLQPVNGTRNGIFVSIVNTKDSIRNSILERGFKGIKGDEVDFTVKDMVFAHNQVMKMYTDSMTGDVRRNKVYLMAKKLDYLPDNFDWASSENELISGSMTLVQESTMYMFHTIPEEFNALVIMVAQLNRMKVNTEKGVKSVWEAYGQPKDQGNGVYDLEWEGGIRGYVERKGVQEELTELDGLEVRKLKRVYQRMHGNYRREERAALEAYVIGQIFIQFRKYLGAILVGSFGSKRDDETLGYYKHKVDANGNPVMKNGKEVMEWQSRMIEGRFRVLASFIFNGLSVINKDGEEMSTDQKAQLVDSVVTFTLMMMMITAMSMIFDDDDDKDSFRLWLEVIRQNSTQHWNFLDQLRTLRQPPATIDRMYKFAVGNGEMLQSLYLLSIGDDAGALTQDGRLKGWATTQKSLPFTSSLYNMRRFIENTDFIGDEKDSLAYNFWRTR